MWQCISKIDKSSANISDKNQIYLDYFYFSYGSNLNRKWMKALCPHSVPYAKVLLRNWKLVFRGLLDVEKTNNSLDCVPGILYKITENCERNLDFYEDFPYLYVKHFEYCKEIKAMFYTMKEKNNLELPNNYYYSILLKGYSDSDIDLSFLEKAMKEAKK